MGVDTDGFLPSGKGRRPPEPCCVWKLVICWLPRGCNSGSPCTIDNNKNKNNTSSWWQPFIFRLDFLFSSRFPSSLTTFHSGIHHFVAWFLLTGLFSFDTIKLKISFTEKTESASDSLDGLCSTEGWKRSAALTQLRHWDWATLRRRFAVQQRTESNDHFVEQSRVTRWSILWVLGWIILTSFYFSYVFDDRDELDFDDFLRIDGVLRVRQRGFSWFIWESIWATANLYMYRESGPLGDWLE